MKRSSKKNAVLGWGGIVELVNHGLPKKLVWSSHKPQSGTIRSKNALHRTEVSEPAGHIYNNTSTSPIVSISAQSGML